MHFGKDWTLMLQSYLILSVKVLDEEASKIVSVFEGLQISIITVHCGCSALDFKFNLKLYNILTWVRDHCKLKQQ